jgi:hypothetical protein
MRECTCEQRAIYTPLRKQSSRMTTSPGKSKMPIPVVFGMETRPTVPKKAGQIWGEMTPRHHPCFGIPKPCAYSQNVRKSKCPSVSQTEIPAIFLSTFLLSMLTMSAVSIRRISSGRISRPSASGSLSKGHKGNSAPAMNPMAECDFDLSH